MTNFYNTESIFIRYAAPTICGIKPANLFTLSESQFMTENLKKFCEDAKVIHIDIDPCSISKNVRVDVPIVGDAKNVLSAMLEEFEKEQYNTNPELKNIWLQQIEQWRDKNPIFKSDCEKLNPVTVIKTIHEYTKDLNPIIVTEVGQHQMWTAQLFEFDKPRSLITSGGLGTMGFGFPAAIGASVGQKDKLVIDIAGDGSIQMNIQEFMTCVDYNLKIIQSSFCIFQLLIG